MTEHKCNKESEITKLVVDVDYIKKGIDELKNMRVFDRAEIKENTLFRQQAKGIIGAIAFVCTVLGGIIIWVAGKLGGK